MKFVALLSALSLALPGAGSAGLRMYGEVKPRHWNWARQANNNVPVPTVHFSLYLGHDPQSIRELHEMYLPRPGHGGWTYWDERVLFLHELGHFYDGRHLSRPERNAFRAAVSTPCSWWSKRCEVPPGEMFAEQYVACGLGMTRREVEAAPSVSYGWLPDPQAEPHLCPLIRSFY